jgi:hypothetical protein
MDDDIRAALAAREPVFHRAEHGRTRAEFDAMMAADYREIAASGRWFDRESVLSVLGGRYADPAYDAMAGLRVEGLAVAHVDGDAWQATYDLWQGVRHTRRSTLWRREGDRWVALFHQGTVVEP